MSQAQFTDAEFTFLATGALVAAIMLSDRCAIGVTRNLDGVYGLSSGLLVG